MSKIRGNIDREYYSNVRTEIFSLLPEHIDSVLDVGGGTGATGRALKEMNRARVVTLWDISQQALDYAVTECPGLITQQVDLNLLSSIPRDGRFLLILVLDVLEHLLEPYDAMVAILDHLEPDGEVIVSLSNVRDLTVVAPLLIRGEWRYAENGVLDKTHLRFFTKKSMRRLLKSTGLRIIEEKAVRNLPRLVIAILSLGLLRDYTAKQYIFRCRLEKTLQTNRSHLSSSKS